MEEFTIDLDKLKVKSGDTANDPAHINSIVNAIIENRKAIIKHEVALRKEELRKMMSKAANAIKYLKPYADRTKYPAESAGPIINRIEDLTTNIQQYAKELEEIEK